jgi:hypothetical protein
MPRPHRKLNPCHALLGRANRAHQRAEGRGVLARRQSFDGQRGIVRCGRATIQHDSETVQRWANLDGLFRSKAVAVERQVQSAFAQHGVESLAHAVARDDSDEPGQSGATRGAGVGDLKLGFGHVFDGTGRFRWGVGLAGTLDTASKAQLGDGALTVSPTWGGGFRFAPDFELVGHLQYEVSVHEAAGRSPIHSLEFKPALPRRTPRGG